MNSKYSEEAVKRINSRLGAGHRVKPYDLTKTDDLKQALLTTVAAYRDYRHYKESLTEIEDCFDESIEYCDTVAWLDLGNASDDADPLIADGFAVLAAASDIFDKLIERAKKNCTKILKTVLSLPPATQKAVFGRGYNIEHKDIDSRIGELFDMLGEVEYHKSMPDNLNAFLKLMEEQWT